MAGSDSCKTKKWAVKYSDLSIKSPIQYIGCGAPGFRPSKSTEFIYCADNQKNLSTLNTYGNFHEISYKMHEEHFKITDNELSDIQKSWFRNDTVGYWRFFKTFEPIIPLIKQHPGNSWLTIGDGRFGRDAIELKKIEPSLNILPTDISIELLDYAKKKGWIDEYKKENAETLSFQDNSFDFVLCRESYHHFPRPTIALYEMLRVAREAVILIEPNDQYHTSFIFKQYVQFKNFVKQLLNRKVYHTDYWNYEESGNYIYSLSKREIEKIALGLNMPAIGHYYYNDYYEAGIEFEKANSKSFLFKKVKNKMLIANLKSKIGLKNYSSIITVLFKKMPEKDLISDLRHGGLKISELPRNPYINY